MNVFKKLNFDTKTLVNFFVIAIGSQIIYSLNCIKSVLYEPYRQSLGVSNAQLGFLFSLVGIVSTIAYLPAGWIQNRFSIRKILSFNLVLSGLSGFYLAFKPTYVGLLMVFASWGLIQEAIYWPSVLKSIRLLGGSKSQGRAFGSLELVRGLTELGINAMAVLIFSIFSQQILGIKVAFAVNSCLMLAVGIITWIVVPEEQMFKKEETKQKSKVAFKGLLKVMAMPEVWFVGIVASAVYTSYIGTMYFVPFLNNVYSLTVIATAIFGIVNTSGMRMIASPLGGFLGDIKFHSSTKLMRVLLIVVTVLISVVLFIPKTSSTMIISLCLLMLITITLYMLRGVYYSPIGELNMPPEISGGAMSIAAFIGYSPMFWAYSVYGYLIDKYDKVIAFKKIFMIMGLYAFVGFIFSIFLCGMIDKKRRIDESNATTAQVTAEG